MVVVSGIVFFVLRALLALAPPGRLPIKKWAALAALGAARFGPAQIFAPSIVQLAL
jgi:hypothetical protein